jgi:hypothetical protein
MGKIFFDLLCLFLGRQIFFQKGYKKLVWFFAGILFVPETIILIDSPVSLTFPRILIIFLLISSLSKSKLFFRQFNYFPLKKGFIIIIIMTCCIGFLDSRLSLDKRAVRSFSFFLEFFSTSFLCYLHVRSLNDLIKLYKIILNFFLVFCIYGIFTYFTKFNDFHVFIAQSFASRDYASEQLASTVERLRITSFAWHPIYYGFIIGIAILMTLMPLQIVRIYKRNNYKYYAFILLLLVINLFLTNSRTPLFALVFGLAIFFLLALNANKKIKFGLFGLVFILMTFTFVPSANMLLSESMKTFTKNGSDLEGSSLEMRNMQLAASVVQFSKSPIIGNGFNYIVEGLGFSSNVDKIKSNQDFYGFESYSYKLLIEQGLVGMIGHFLFFLLLFKYFFNNSFNNKSIVRRRFGVLNIAMTATFLLFIFGTGDLGSFKFFMSIMGINIAGLELMKKRERIFLMSKENEV